MDHWAYWNKVELDFSRPGRHGDNAVNEAFNGVLRRECLSQHYFLDVEEASRVLEAWRIDYNNERPHGSLAQRSPMDFRAVWQFREGSNDMEICAPCGTEMG